MEEFPTLADAKTVIFGSIPSVPPTWDIVKECEVLTKACEDPEKLSLEEMLRCLDFPGLIAEHGARFLYVRTGRDNLGWRHAGADGIPFSTAKEDWTAYLKTHGLL
jgi:hypothetical protein